MREDKIRDKVAWAHLNMAWGSWIFTDETHALNLWIKYECIWNDVCGTHAHGVGLKKVKWGRVNLKVWQPPLFNLLGPEGMDSNDFQYIHGRRGLNIIRSKQKNSGLGIIVIWVDFMGIMQGYDGYACNAMYAT